MPTINPYLHFIDNSEEAFNFYKSVFGGEFLTIMRFKDVPEQPGMKIDDSEKDKVMHVALPVGKNVLMASDSVDSMRTGPAPAGNNISLSVSTESDEEADKIFNALSAGGKVTMPMADAFWGSYFGMLKDKYGIHWMISHDKNQPQS